MRTPDRSLINFRSPTREGNLALLRAGVEILASEMAFGAGAVIGPLDERTGAVAGLYFSGSQEEVDLFYECIKDHLKGQEMEFIARIGESTGSSDATG